MLDFDRPPGRRRAGRAAAAAVVAVGCALLLGSSTPWQHRTVDAAGAAPLGARTGAPAPVPSPAAAVQQQPPPVDPGPPLSAGTEDSTTPAVRHVGSVETGGNGSVSVGDPNGIPAVALAAYRRAAATVDTAEPGCQLSWTLLAGIGRVESDHGQYGGAQLLPDGLSTIPIIGPALNGHGTALIRDTDGGRLDGDPVYDHAVGPMQFIPSTWASWGVDGDQDGVANPFDINDATLAAADYLCAAGGDLATPSGQDRAILAYNHSTAYLHLVLAYTALYAGLNPGPLPPAPIGPGPTPGPTTSSAPTSRAPTAGPSATQTIQPVSSQPASSAPDASRPASAQPSPATSRPDASPSATSASATRTVPTPTHSPARSGQSASAPASDTAASTVATSATTSATSCPTASDTGTPTTSGTPTDAGTSTDAGQAAAGDEASNAGDAVGASDAAGDSGAAATDAGTDSTASDPASSTSSDCVPANPTGPQPSTATAGLTGVTGFVVVGLALVIVGTVARRRTTRQH